MCFKPYLFAIAFAAVVFPTDGMPEIITEIFFLVGIFLAVNVSLVPRPIFNCKAEIRIASSLFEPLKKL